MKRLLILLTISCTAAFAQWSDFCSSTSSSVLCGETKGKLNHQEGAGAPGSRYKCTQGKDQYTDTTNNDVYDCSVTGDPGTWVLRPTVVALSGKQATISGAPGMWPMLGTASTHATTDFQPALTVYSTI